MPSIINITVTSNVGDNGVWAFKLDEGRSDCLKSKRGFKIFL